MKLWRDKKHRDDQWELDGAIINELRRQVGERQEELDDVLAVFDNTDDKVTILAMCTKKIKAQYGLIISLES